MKYASLVVLSFSILAGLTTSEARAQFAKTWVSSVGDDANNCSRTSPCQSFAGALAKTAPRGEIDVLDAGSFGQLAITKAVTIDGHGFAAVFEVNDRAVVVIAGVNDVVVIRNLVVQGAGTATDGIVFQSGKQLLIERCHVFGFTGNGILAANFIAGGRILTVSNSTVYANFGSGVRTQAGITTVSHSVIMGNGVGVIAEFDGVINADSNVITGNRVAVSAGNGGADQTAATVRLSNNDVYGNLTGFGCGGGVLASAGNNRKGSNVGGTVPACSPTVTISQQ
jgi:hypothetical protein